MIIVTGNGKNLFVSASFTALIRRHFLDGKGERGKLFWVEVDFGKCEWGEKVMGEVGESGESAEFASV
jgi:hypothetical protein